VTVPFGPGAERRQFQQRFVDFARRHEWFGRTFNAITFSRSRKVVSYFESLLPKHGRLLDIGAGTGHVAALLGTHDRSVIGCDIMNLLMLPLPYVLADGGQLPFLSGSFDTALLITVLHHVSKSLHSGFLKEAARVLKPGGTLIVMEDTFNGAIEREITRFSDSVMNGEFAGHPHANRPIAEWVKLMTQTGFDVRHQVEHVAWYGIFRMRHGIVVGIRE
jgi:ubiquinone/menaquinone biosynthesis C-methylase UbiE